MTWQEHAACIGKPQAWFFPGAPDSRGAADAVCPNCPVRVDCLEWALENGERGVWGGTSEEERAVILRERGQLLPPVIRSVCGSDAGYAAHRRGFEQKCADCARAHLDTVNAWKREWRKRRKDAGQARKVPA